MTLDDIAGRAAAHRLMVMGAFHAGPEDDLPEDIRTLVMLGPMSGPDYWTHLTSQPEWDGAPDPVDRWSRRVIGGMACDLGGKAYFPFGGPPWKPFIAWAKRTGRAWASPVTILVHDTAGLMVSYRGALGVRERLELPATGPRPCEGCAGKPCLTACPVGALSGAGYDVPACHAFLDTQPGRDCLTQGCAVRRACPVSQAYGRVPHQSAYHMGHFHK
jgi:epoxyqueuosine reductase